MLSMDISFHLIFRKTQWHSCSQLLPMHLHWDLPQVPISRHVQNGTHLLLPQGSSFCPSVAPARNLGVILDSPLLPYAIIQHPINHGTPAILNLNLSLLPPLFSRPIICFWIIATTSWLVSLPPVLLSPIYTGTVATRDFSKISHLTSLPIALRIKPKFPQGSWAFEHLTPTLQPCSTTHSSKDRLHSLWSLSLFLNFVWIPSSVALLPIFSKSLTLTHPPGLRPNRETFPGLRIYHSWDLSYNPTFLLLLLLPQQLQTLSPYFGQNNGSSEMSHSLVPVHVTLQSKRCFAVVIKLRLLKWGDYLGLLRWTLNVIEALIRRRERRVRIREGDIIKGNRAQSDEGHDLGNVGGL